MKRHSLSQKLFRTYAGWFTLYLFILLSISVGFMASIVKKDVTETQRRLINSIDENVQNYFEEMNAFSIELLNSKEFKRIAIKELPEEYESGRSTSILFSQLYKEAYKMISLRYNIGVIVDDEYYVWMGSNYYISKLEQMEIHTYDNLIRNESPTVKYLERNEYLQMTNPNEGDQQSYITLSRTMDYGNRYLNGKAILEVQIEKEEFINELFKRSAIESGDSLKINLYDSDGNAIYEESSGEVVAVHKIFDDNVTIVYTKDNTAMNKFQIFLSISLGLCVLVIGIIFLMTYKISEQISEPINSIYEHVQQINIKEGGGFKEIETDILELQFLSHSLKQMSDQIEESLDEIISLKDFEMQAKMLALQAQMQPHFLFNTLMTIASMAEEDGNKRIYEICMNLNSMFRYIAAEEVEGVRIFEEIKYIEHYVDIMKKRFPACIVDINIPLELMECMLPKLTIQPLVENAFKYCNRKNPEIKVNGYLREYGRWEIEVVDNGAGFTKEKKEEIMKKCEMGLKSEKTLSNRIDEMGLVNVFVRMKFFYGDDMSFFIEENKGRIVIGGIKHGERRKPQNKDNDS